MDQKLMNSKEAAEYLGISQPVFRSLVAQGTVPVVMVPGLKKPRFSTSDLDELIQKGKQHEKPNTSEGSLPAASESAGAENQERTHRKRSKKHSHQV